MATVRAVVRKSPIASRRIQGFQDPNSNAQGGTARERGPTRQNIYGDSARDKLAPKANNTVQRLAATTPTNTALTAASATPAAFQKGANAVAPVTASGPQGGVGQGGNGSQLPYSGDPWTGAAGKYVPGKQGDIFANPGIVLQDVLRGLGVTDPAQSGYYYSLEPWADVINELMLLQNPSAQGSGESAVNYMNTAFKNLSTPGGRAPDFDVLRASLENADPNNALGLFLGGANDQRTQMQNFLKLGRAAAEAGLHPYYADAFNQLMAVAANDYMNATAKGETANFGDYWNQNYRSAFR